MFLTEKLIGRRPTKPEKPKDKFELLFDKRAAQARGDVLGGG
jgi:hypothetical protein